MQFHSEGGLELLSRFSEKSRSINIDEYLFSGAVDNRSIIEIVGTPFTGKSLLYRFIAKCILPAQYKKIKIDGCDASAILIDTGHTQISKVAELMTSMICSACETAGARLPDEKVDLIVTKSLENLTVISCCDNTQFQLTLHTLEDELLSNGRVAALLAIDNILAYYWRERREKNTNFSMDWYTKSLITLIRARTSQFNIVTVYTRWDKWENCVSEHGAQTRHSCPLEQTSIDYRIQFRNESVPQKFIAHVQSANETKQVQCIISDSGIKWIS
ncbi:uncharacterized protein LOC109861040 [Pseudomyrmex gracilis]|uniref:uncharacterized protein LOC109861040 n=1 Tax=Pseudomyrmex gracilis TaxID=219809 RepID=UPI0009949076|nr:uncharacterized protein LOC109861040 [Pseudomyrmex gracilis]